MSQPPLAAVVADAAVRSGLAPQDLTAEAGWTLWERRTFGSQWTVGLWEPFHGFATARELRHALRSSARKAMKPSWWRGAYAGVVAALPGNHLPTADIKPLVDLTADLQLTVHWIIFASGVDSVLGVHTWAEVHLSPVYRAILRTMANSGGKVASLCRERSGVMRALGDLGALSHALHTLDFSTHSGPHDFNNRF